MTPEHRALVDGARGRAERASSKDGWTWDTEHALVRRNQPDRGHICFVYMGLCEENGRFIAAARADVPALCDLADEQAAAIAILREALDTLRSLRDHISRLYDESKARITSLEASVALLDEQGRKMKQEREEACERERSCIREAQGVIEGLRSELEAQLAEARAAEEAAAKSAAELRAEVDRLRTRQMPDNYRPIPVERMPEGSGPSSQRKYEETE